MKTRKSKKEGTSVGRKIISSLREAVELLERGERLEDHFTVRTVSMPDEPQLYNARAIQVTREKLRVSQAVFAHLIGVSPKLVQAWEQGQRKPSAMARRLFDQINEQPERWLAILRKSA
jgi:putative transcriptional regulator